MLKSTNALQGKFIERERKLSIKRTTRSKDADVKCKQILIPEEWGVALVASTSFSALCLVAAYGEDTVLSSG